MPGCSTQPTNWRPGWLETETRTIYTLKKPRRALPSDGKGATVLTEVLSSTLTATLAKLPLSLAIPHGGRNRWIRKFQICLAFNREVRQFGGRLLSEATGADIECEGR